MNQLNVASDDLRNVLSGISAAVLLIGSDLRIHAFSGCAERLLNLIPTDVGRPVAYIRTVMVARDLEQTVSQVISTATPREGRVRATDGFWYAMRIMPYRTSDNAIRGALIEFVRAPTATRVPAPGELGELATTLLAQLPEALVLLDEQLRVFWANRAFCELLKLDADVFGRPLEELWDGRNREPELWTLLEEVNAGGRTFSSVVLDHPFADESPPVSISARRLPLEGDRSSLTLVLICTLPRGQDVRA